MSHTAATKYEERGLDSRPSFKEIIGLVADYLLILLMIPLVYAFDGDGISQWAAISAIASIPLAIGLVIFAGGLIWVAALMITVISLVVLGISLMK